MTAREKKIWDLLMEHDSLTSAEIAGKLHISDRTVRSDIKAINTEQKKEVILARKGQGYYIGNKKPEETGVRGDPGGENDMEWEIVRKVLFEKETPYLELADELYISDTLLAKAVSRINRNMDRRYGRGMIRKKNGLLVLELSEEEKREYYIAFAALKNVSHYFEPEVYQPYFEYVDFLELKQLFFQSLAEEKTHFYDTTIMRILLGTAVMAERTAAGYILPEIPVDGTLDTASEREDFAAVRLYHYTENLTGRKLPSAELRYLKKLFRNDFYAAKEGGSGQRTEEILNQILIEINVEYGFDFSGDQEFCHEMAEQLNGTLRRAENEQHIVNPALVRIKSKYPLEYDIAIFFADRFRRFTGVAASEDEIGQFAVHFIWSMETNLGNMHQKAALINPFGKQLKDLIEKRIGEMGECRLTVAYNYSLFDYPVHMPKDVAVVLTTVPLPKAPADVPVILCRNFLDYHEKEKLLTVMKENQVGTVRNYFRTLFKPSLFFTDMEFDSREAALAFLCGKLYEQGYVEEGFFESVMAREAIAPTAFEPGFVFAHAMENNASRTAVCTCVLKNKIDWGGFKIRIIFLFALASSWNHTITPVYNVMIDNLFQANTVHKLARQKNCREFMELLL